MKLFSIIIPVYNVYNYIDECLASILYDKTIIQDIEIILVDDGSTDGSGHKCDKYKDNYRDLIVVVHQENKGLSGARNTGIRKAKGKYIILLDSDDKLAPKALHNLKIAIHEDNPDVVINRVDSFDDGKTSFFDYNYISNDEIKDKDHIDVYSYLIHKKRFTFTAWTFSVNRSWLLENNVLFYEGILHEDELWTHEILIKCNRILVNESSFYYYRKNRANSIMSSRKIKHLKDYSIIIDELLKLVYVYHDARIIEITYIKAADIYWSLLYNTRNFIDSKYGDALERFLSQKSFLLLKNKNNIAIFIYILFKTININNTLKLIRLIKRKYLEKLI